MDSDTSNWRATAFFIALLLPIAIVSVVTGSYWLRVANPQIGVGNFSPDGSRFVAIHVNVLHGRSHVVGTFVHDALSGDVVADLSGFQWFRETSLRWSSDGRKLVGVALRDDGPGNRGWGRLVVLQVSEDEDSVQIVSDRKNAEWNLAAAFFDEHDHVVYVNQTRRNGRPCLEFVADDAEVRGQVEYGRDEAVRLYEESPNSMLTFFRSNGAKLGDYVITDGKTDVFCHIGLASQKVTPFPPKVYPANGNSDFAFESVVNEKQDIEVVVRRVDDLGEVLLQVPSKGPQHGSLRVVSTDGNRFVQCYAGTEYSYVETYDLATKERNEFSCPMASRIWPTPDGQIMLYTESRRLIRMNLDTGEQQELLDIRPHMGKCRAVAIGGLAALWVFGLWLGGRLKTPYPFFDMACVLLLSLFVVIGWSVYGVREVMGRIDIDSAAFVFFGAWCAFIMVWASSFKSFWGVVLSSALAGSASAVGIMFVWGQGDARRTVEGVIGSSVLMFWMIMAMFFVRKRYGFMTREKTLDDQGLSHSQMSLKQILILMASCCLFLGFMRLVDVRQFIQIPDVTLFIVWLVSFSATMALVAVIAAVTALKTSRFVASLFAFVALASCVMTTHHLTTGAWNVSLMWSVLTRYGLLLAAGALIWIAIRYCRRRGYRFTKSGMATA